jgi:hypothetical protein
VEGKLRRETFFIRVTKTLHHNDDW